MTAEELRTRIEKLAPETHVEVTDLKGTQDHWKAVVVSPVFEGKLMIEQHRMVYSLLEREIRSDEVHALTLKTYTPAQYEKLGRPRP